MVSVTAEQKVSVPLLRAGWETMTFLHWPLDPERVQALLPRGVTVDVYDEAAWVSMTPFVMTNMRPLSLPAVMSTSETNLRTYVRGPDGRDGLWFLTIDAGSRLVVTAVRGAVGAPYHKAAMSVQVRGDTVAYSGSRGGSPASYRLEVQPGEPMAPTDLDVWLTSRWRAYTRHLGRLLVTPVEHEPWPLRRATLVSLEQSVTDSVGLGPLPPPPLVHFSDGVHRVRLGRPSLLGASDQSPPGV